MAELFEARRPKDPATISEVDGIVRFGEIKRGKREVIVQPARAVDGQWIVDDAQEAQLYEVPAGKHLRVHEGDRVRAGDRLSEGPVNPHDILRIKGPRAVQEYLLNEVQEVYRLQGVKINDKHIGVIVRQMLQKVRIVDPGETEFLEGEHVDKPDLPRAERAGEEEEADSRRRPSRCCSASPRRASRRSRSSRRRRSRRPRGCSPTPPFAGPGTTFSGSRRTSSSATSSRPAPDMYRYQEIEIEGEELPRVEELPGTETPLPGVFSGSFAETGFSLGGNE